MTAFAAFPHLLALAAAALLAYRESRRDDPWSVRDIESVKKQQDAMTAMERFNTKETR